MKKSASILITLIGVGLCSWGGSVVLSSDFELASKWSAEGRDSNAALIFLIIGICCILYGLFEIFISRSSKSQ